MGHAMWLANPRLLSSALVTLTISIQMDGPTWRLLLATCPLLVNIDIQARRDVGMTKADDWQQQTTRAWESVTLHNIPCADVQTTQACIHSFLAAPSLQHLVCTFRNDYKFPVSFWPAQPVAPNLRWCEVVQDIDGPLDGSDVDWNALVRTWMKLMPVASYISLGEYEIKIDGEVMIEALRARWPAMMVGGVFPPSRFHLSDTGVLEALDEKMLSHVTSIECSTDDADGNDDNSWPWDGHQWNAFFRRFAATATASAQWTSIELRLSDGVSGYLEDATLLTILRLPNLVCLDLEVCIHQGSEATFQCMVTHPRLQELTFDSFGTMAISWNIQPRHIDTLLHSPTLQRLLLSDLVRSTANDIKEWRQLLNTKPLIPKFGILVLQELADELLKENHAALDIEADDERLECAWLYESSHEAP
jgi:hypothetical protein